jgi:hypothetical protein
VAKKTGLGKPRRGTATSNRGSARKAKIAALVDELNRLELRSPKVAEAIELFKGWLADESGYDEKVWPRLKKALEQERERVGARRLFDA